MFRRPIAWIVIVVLILVLVWPGGLLTGWGWAWGHKTTTTPPAAGEQSSAGYSKAEAEAICSSRGTTLDLTLGDVWPTLTFRCVDSTAPTPPPAGGEIIDPGSGAPTPAPEGDQVLTSGDTVTVKDANGTVMATIKFVTKVDNMPTEWLRDRQGILYLYQSGIGNQVELEITLMVGASFAMDGDGASVDGQDLGKVNDPADFLLYADAPGTYKVTASSFGLAVGPYSSAEDKAGFVLADREAAIGNDGRPVYYLSADGTISKQ